MMRLRPLLKRFTRRKKKNDLVDEIQKADKKKNHSVKVRLLAQIKRLKSRKKAKDEPEDVEVDKVEDGDVEDRTDEPGDIIVHVNPDTTGDETTQEKLEPRESVVSALQITQNAHDKEHTENLQLRVPEVTVDKDVHRRSLDQLISDRLSGVSHDSPLWSRKRLGTNRTASNISIYSKQQHEPFETRTIWTQTDDNVRHETVDKLVGPSPGGSLGFGLQDTGVGPSPATSLGVRLESVGVDPSSGSSLDTKLEDDCVGPSPYGSKEFGIETSFSIKPVENPRLAKIKSRILRRLNCPNLANCEASVCVELLRLPKPPFLIALNRKLSEGNAFFNVEFLELNGLDYLLILMDYIAEAGLATIFDVLLMLVVSECATSLVNSTAGRDYLLAHGEHVVSMARALETKNMMVKMQIFELLSALCVYSKDGYYLTLDALERYRSWQKLQYRMSLLVNELRKADLTTYRTTIMAMVNAIIFANENLRDRVRIRNEFISLNIIETIQSLRADDDDELSVQCDVFEEELNADSDAMENMNDGKVNLNDHMSVFMAIHKRVQGTPLSATFLGVLHSLLQIEPFNSQSESMWTLIEKIAQEAISKDAYEEGEKLLNKCKEQKKTHKDVETQTDEQTRPGSGILRRGPINRSSQRDSLGRAVPDSPIPAISVPSPPPPPPGGLATMQLQKSAPVAPPPPALALNRLSASNIPAPPPVPGGASSVPVPPPPPGSPIPPPPPPSPGMAPPSPLPPGSPAPPPPPGGFRIPASPMAQQGPPPPKAIETPAPGCKMRTINWNKIPLYAFKQDSVWGDVSKMSDSIDVEYGKLEELFSQKVTSPPATALSPEAEDGGTRARRNSHRETEVTLLDPKKSMNVNIFLKQFRKSNEAIIDNIKQGDARALGVEKLKGLLKILPQQDEIESIIGFEGDVDKLGNAEKFFHALLNLKSYKIRIEIMLLKADFNSQIGAVRPNVQVLNSVCRKLIDNKSLKSFLRFVLHAGNFINKGSSSGDAIGFRIASLNKLMMTKSNVAKMTLLHHLVEEAEKKQKDSLAFVDDLLDLLQKSSRFTMEGILTEFNTLKNSVHRLKSQLENVEQEVKDQFSSFLEEAENDVGDVDEAIGRVQKLSVRLAHHYCENENSFKVDEFLESFKEFCEKCKSCQQDLETWRVNEEKAEQRRKTQAELAEKRRSGHGQLGLKVPSQDRKIVDNLVNEIRKGKVLRRLSMRHKTGEAKK